MEQYSVVLSGFARGEEFFRGRMMKQGMKVAQIERVISAVPCVLKQGLSFQDAKSVEELFRDAGAIVQLRREGDPAAEDITYEPPVSAPAPAPAPALEVPPPSPSANFPSDDDNSRILRLLLIAAIAVLSSLALVSFVSSYKVGARIHDFSALVDDSMSNDMVGIARQTGGIVGENDLYELVDQYARRTHVKVEVRNLRAGFAEIYPGPGGTCGGAPPPIAERMPRDKRMQWMLRVRDCTADPWIIGFDVSITARYGMSKDTVDVQQWIFAADWIPSS